MRFGPAPAPRERRAVPEKGVAISPCPQSCKADFSTHRLCTRIAYVTHSEDMLQEKRSHRTQCDHKYMVKLHANIVILQVTKSSMHSKVQ